MTGGEGRLTWTPAKGGNEQSGTRVSSRDIASHTTLNSRKERQDTQEELLTKKMELHGEPKVHEGRQCDEASIDDDYKDETDAQALLAAAEILGARENRLQHNGVSRRWDNDVVFRNQGSRETKIPKSFVIDKVRNDFHTKNLSTYMI